MATKKDRSEYTAGPGYNTTGEGRYNPNDPNLPPPPLLTRENMQFGGQGAETLATPQQNLAIALQGGEQSGVPAAGQQGNSFRTPSPDVPNPKVSQGLMDKIGGLMSSQAEMNTYLMNLADRAEQGGSIFLKKIGNPAMDALKAVGGLQKFEAGADEASKLAKAEEWAQDTAMKPAEAESMQRHRSASDVLALATADVQSGLKKYYEGRGAEAAANASRKGAFQDFLGLSDADQEKYIRFISGTNAIEKVDAGAQIAKPQAQLGVDSPADYLTEDDRALLNPLANPSGIVSDWVKREKRRTNGLNEADQFAGPTM